MFSGDGGTATFIVAASAGLGGLRGVAAWAKHPIQGPLLQGLRLGVNAPAELGALHQMRTWFQPPRLQPQEWPHRLAAHRNESFVLW